MSGTIHASHSILTSEPPASEVPIDESTNAVLQAAIQFAGEDESGPVLPRHLVAALVSSWLTGDDEDEADSTPKTDREAETPSAEAEPGVAEVFPPELVRLLRIENWSDEQTLESYRPVVGREEHWSGARADDWGRILEGVCRRQRPHVLLTGDSGIGKSAWVRELAREALQGHIPALRGHLILRIHADRLLPEESRPVLDDLFSSLARIPVPVLLCVNDLKSLLRGKDGLDQSAALAAALDRVPVRLIGEMEPHAWQELIGSRVELRDRFTSLEVAPPDGDLLCKIVSSAADQMTESVGTTPDPDLASDLVRLTSHVLLSRPSPRTELDILSRTMERLDFRHDSQGEPLPAFLTLTHCLPAIAELSGMPVASLRDEPECVDFPSLLRERVFGQESAVDAVAEELSLIRAGLSDGSRPASVLLFAGLTGTGKTELAKAIAEVYSSSGRLRTYSMGNFTEPHSVSGLIRVPPGYVGHEQGGPLVRDLLADPSAVFLLDEAEKAHPNVWKPFLTLFDEGWIVDQRGQKAFADRAIFILTTNAGDRAIGQLLDSGSSEHEVTERVMQTLSRVRQERSSQPVFPAPFLARIGRILVFRPLSRDATRRIVSRQVERLQSRWRDRFGVDVRIDEAVQERVTEHATDENSESRGRHGGRIVGTLVRDRIESPLLQFFATRAVRPDAVHVRLADADGAGLDVQFALPTEPSLS